MRFKWTGCHLSTIEIFFITKNKIVSMGTTANLKINMT